MQAPTPFSMDNQYTNQSNLSESQNIINENKLNFELKKEVLSDKNSKFSLFFIANNFAELFIKSIKDDLIQRVFSNKFPVKVIKKIDILFNLII